MYQQRSQAQRLSTAKTLCLNPECFCFTRYCSVVIDGQTITKIDKIHENCKRWLWLLDGHQPPKLIEQSTSLQKEELDFMNEPLTAIWQLLAFSQGNLKESVDQIFSHIKYEFEGKLKEVQERINIKMDQFIIKSKNIKKNVLQLMSKIKHQIWNFENQKFYKQHLFNPLRQIQNNGILRLMNFQSLSLEVDRIKEQINKIQWYFWTEQPEIERQQRLKSREYQQELDKLLEWRQIQPINKKVQEIQNNLKIRPFSFRDNNDSSKNQTVSLSCGKCNQLISSSSDPFKIKSKQIKRSECIISLFIHFCKRHKEQIIECYRQQFSKPHLKMSLQQVVRQVCTSRIKTCIIIDRQNYATKNKYEISRKDTYLIEVVAENRENIATGRYLVAQSLGKDAADILIILTLYQLAKINPKMRVILITNDHFGQTSIPIFSSLGIKIEVMTNITQQLVLDINSQKEQKMIDQK